MTAYRPSTRSKNRVGKHPSLLREPALGAIELVLHVECDWPFKDETLANWAFELKDWSSNCLGLLSDFGDNRFRVHTGASSSGTSLGCSSWSADQESVSGFMLSLLSEASV